MPYGFAQGIGDFLGDFNDESGKIRAANEKKASDDAQIEQRALEHLANADDPQIRAAAVTAMLTPKKGAGGSGLSKWFGQQRDHPVFDQVHQLINGGGPGGAAPVQPFLSTEEKSAQQRSGSIVGATRGAAQGMREEGLEPPPGMIEGVARGAAGSPQRVTQNKPGIITLEDGSQIAGSYDPVSGSYADSDGTPLSGVKSWQPNGPRAAGNPNPGATWTTTVDAQSPTGYSRVHVDAQGKEIGRTSTAAPQAPPNQIFQTPGGYGAVAPGRAGGAPPQVVPVQGGATPTKTEQPSVSFEALRNIMNDAERRAQASIFKPGGIPPEQKEIDAARDREAKGAGFNNWKDLADQVAAGQRAISGAVQAPPAGIDTGGAAPAAGTPAKGTKSGVTPPIKAPVKKPVPGKLDVDLILKELSKFQ